MAKVCFTTLLLAVFAMGVHSAWATPVRLTALPIDQRSVPPQSQNTSATPVRLTALPIDILEVQVTAHQFSDEFKYATPPAPELGALVRIFAVHRDSTGSPAQPRLLFNGETEAHWLAAGAWTWYETPANLGTPEAPWTFAPGALAVFTFNAAGAEWGVGSVFTLDIEDELTGARESVILPLVVDPLRVRRIACFAPTRDGIVPERLLVHVSNGLVEPVSLREMAVYTGANGAERRVVPFSTRPHEGTALPGDWLVVDAATGPLPLTHGFAQLEFETPSGERISRWAHLRFKADRFDIGSGWLTSPTPAGVVPLREESFLRTLKGMHVSSFWGESLSGYTDDTGPDGLYTRYPLRQMAYFEDIDRYNDDAWVARIHGVDRLGEPQHGGMPPMEVYETLKRYDAARYPTTLTLSDEKDWRYYAGICDFPHYDSYRVSAPAMDTWRLYDCWDRPLFWGAPLEGIGVMTRSLRELSEPQPIALWSQNAHPGWQDQFTRRHCSPTNDEILIQAYQGLANGIISLYWYSLETWSLLKYRDAIEMTRRIGREIRLLEDLYLEGQPTHFEREPGEQRPTTEFNVISAPDAALLFAIDLTYYPDHDARVFTFDSPRTVEAEFPLPSWLRHPVDVFRVDGAGVYEVDWTATETGVRLRDSLDRVGIYVAALSPGERAARESRLAALKADEQAVGFDPGGNDADYATLLRALGFEGLSELDAFR